jgi:hypothetical protein
MKRMPRILKINKVNDDLTISVVFNLNPEESRVIDFKNILSEPGFEDRPEAILLDPQEFKKVKLVDNTLSWHNVGQYVTFKGKKIEVPFEMAPDSLYQYSMPDC